MVLLQTFLKIFIYLPILLHQVLVVGLQTLSCSLWILVPCPGIEPRPPALEEQSLNHWTTKEVRGLSVPVNEMGFAAAPLAGIFNALRVIFSRVVVLQLRIIPGE